MAGGFEGRWDYGAIGTVATLTARLCTDAKAGHLLASPRAADASCTVPKPAADGLRLKTPA